MKFNCSPVRRSMAMCCLAFWGLLSPLAVCGDVVGFWPLTDVTPGETATAATVVNEIDAAAFAATPSRLRDLGKVPTFSDDVPGHYIYDSQTPTNCVSANPRSLVFDSDDPTVGNNYGGRVDFADLATYCAGQEAFTVEFFFKAREGSWRQVFAMPLNGAGKNRVKLQVPGWDGFGNPSLLTFYQQTPDWKLNKTAPTGTKWTDQWHHFAAVYANGQVSGYVDRMLIGTQNTTTSPSGSVPLTLGCGDDGYECFLGKISCLRVSKRALAPAEMLLARETPYADGQQTVGFWPLTDVMPGETATAATVVNEIDASMFAATPSRLRDLGKVPTFSDDVPGHYIYDSQTPTNCVSANPRSLVFDSDDPTVGNNYGGRVDFADLATYCAGQEAFTVEFFFKAHEGACRQVFAMPLNGAGKNRVKLQVPGWDGFGNPSLLTFYQQTPDWKLNKTAPTGTKWTDQWHHFAAVYANGQVSGYVDRMLIGTQNTTLSPTAAVPLTLGSGDDGYECFLGKISCLRVSKRALAPAEMLLARETPYADGQQTVGFWPLTDVTPGETATAATVVNEIDASMFAATPSRLRDLGKVPTFSDDVPGRYIYDSLFSTNCVSANPRSLVFESDDPNAGNDYGGRIDFADLATYCAGQEAFTLEFFFKADEGAWRQLFTLPLKGAGESRVKLQVPGYEAGAGNPSLLIFYQQTPDWKLNKVAPAGEKWTDAWHHFAVVYTNGQVSGYVDRALIGSHDTTLSPSAAVPLTLGCGENGYECFRGKISCLRVSKKALKPVDMLVARGSECRDEPTVGFWPLTDAVPGTVATPATIVNEANRSMFAAAVSTRGSNGLAPTFSDDVPGNAIYDSQTPTNCLSVNPRSLVFDSTDPNFGNESGARIDFAELASFCAGQDAFTVEFFFKAREGSWRQVFAMPLNGAWGNRIKLQVPGYEAGAGNPSLLTFYQQTPDWKLNKAAPTGTKWTDRWHHFAVVYANGKVSGYVDRTLIGTQNTTASPSSVLPLTLGCGDDGYECFLGKVSCLRVSKRALSPESFLLAKRIGTVLIIR